MNPTRGRIIARMVALGTILFAASCGFDSASHNITCQEEGRRDGDRVCRDGVWLAADALADGGFSQDGESCRPESDAVMCARLGFDCDQVTVTDDCGNPRELDCGSCAAPHQCGAGGEDNICACPGQSTADFCAASRASCGELTATDACGTQRTAVCGECEAPQTCGGGGTPNQCGCPSDAEVCEALGYECGTVDVSGMCGDRSTVDCGTCGANAECDATTRVCRCKAGFELLDQGCVDVDECDTGLANCALNATCTNKPGTFECACNAGYVGDGFTCSVSSLATSVQQVELTLAEGTETDALQLPVDVDAAMAVPFVTVRTAGSGAAASNFLPDVWLEPDGAHTNLHVRRQETGGSVTVVATVVEFDPAKVKVQSGTFTMLGGSLNIGIDPIDFDASFVVFNYRFSSFDESKRNYLVSVRPGGSGTSMRFRRHGDQGNVLGHYWVVTARNGEFSVQHTVTSISQESTTSGATLASSVDRAKSFLLYSAQTTEADQAGEDAHATCTLTTATEVTCRRHDNDDNSLVDLEVQVISFAGSQSVTRGTLLIGSNASEASTAAAGATSNAMAWPGRLALTAGLTEQRDSSVPATYATLEVVGSGPTAEISMKRDEASPAYLELEYELVEW